MKKIVFFIGSFLMASLSLTSCLRDGENAIATINYVAKMDSINFMNPVDTVWGDNIEEALANMKVLYNVFEVADTSNTTLYSNAVYLCDYKAGTVFNNKLNGVSLSEIKKNIFNLHADSLVNLGYARADSIPLNPFYLYTSLWSYYSGSMVYYYENIVK